MVTVGVLSEDEKDENERMLWGSKFMLGGGVIALATVIAIGMGTYWKSELQFVTAIDSSNFDSRSQLAPAHRLSSQVLAGIVDNDETTTLQEKDATLKAGDTLIETLTISGIPEREAHAATTAMAKVYDPRSLKAGQKIKLFLRESDDRLDKLSFVRVEFIPETDRLISVTRGTRKSFSARSDTLPHVSDLVVKTGTINSSFFESARTANIPSSVLLKSYNTLSKTVDFQRDFRVGDTFQIGFNVYDDGPERGWHPGEMVYVSFDLSKRSIRAYRYTTTDGYTDFFDESGMSLSSKLMKTPIEGARLSSLFGKRKHPVLGYTRMHRGIDFAASRGTPVLAAGDGILAQMERNGNFGKYIQIKHDGRYSTSYAHLNRYADGLKQGDRVQQGDVIGYVGATGLTTGPNLHYEILRDRRQTNPMRVRLPARLLLEGKELELFTRAKQKIRLLLAAGLNGKPPI